MIGRRSDKPEIALRSPCGLDVGPNAQTFVALEGSAKQSMETGKTRLVIAALIFLFAFAAIGVRLFDLAMLTQGNEPSLADASPDAPLETGRANIVDRNGAILATTLPSSSLYANPRQILDPEAAATLVAGVLPEFSASELTARLGADRSFVWLKRNLTPRQQAEVNALGIPGLYFLREQSRVYPQGALAAHIVGFNNVDNRGIAGLEQSFDDLLRGSSTPLQLSIDIRVQHVLTRELQAAMQEFQGIGAAGLVMDAKTGEILAMTSLPSFDPGAPGEAPADARFNRATLGVYEVGSVFKIFTTAMALEAGAVSLESGYDTSKPIRIARFTINDFHPKNRWLSLPEIFMYSSNIGSVHMAMDVGTEGQQRFLGELGLLRATSFELPEVGQPMIPSTWREINTMTIAYGHGIAVTPLQVTRAMGAVINGGQLLPATLLKRLPGETVPGRRVMSQTTSAQMRWLTRLVVQHGTGRKADAPGYLVGGKTGTADKLKPSGSYDDDARIASFLAGFPMDDPRYVIFAMVDEPQPTEATHGYATGGWVTAPVVGRVVEQIAPLLGVVPRASEEPEVVENALLVPARLKGPPLAAN
ncbi:MAG: penicillin-binding protein 2 [Rhodovibrionaceae bacterium]